MDNSIRRSSSSNPDQLATLLKRIRKKMWIIRSFKVDAESSSLSTLMRKQVGAFNIYAARRLALNLEA